MSLAAWIALQDSDVEISTFYRGNDTSPDFPTFYGIYHADGTPKKTALAFDLWSDMVAYAEQRELSITSGAEEALWVLVGEDPAGNMALLISNLDAAPSSYEVSFDIATGLDLSGYEARLFEVSDNLSGIGVFPANPQSIAIGGHTVHLVTLTIPEPATLALLGVGALTLLLLCRRRK